jgi:4-hydroxybenzoate polyprenyltransferase
MKVSLFLFFLPILQVNAFQLQPKKYIPNYSLETIKKQKSIDVSISTKFQHFKKIIRSNGILPTSLLCFVGGFIINPSIIGLLQTPSFLVSTINIILIMSSSMIMNDIFDINADRINHSNRPLVNGDISRKEAFIYLLGMLALTEYLNIRFLKENLQNIVHVSILNIFLYTPFYKKIPFIKNIFCAGLISFSIFFSGLSASTNHLIEMNPRFNILSVAVSILFFSSWNIEVLLDINDYDGDRENRIYTVPVLFGKKYAWIFACFLFYFNILSNTLSLSYLFGRPIGMILPIISSPTIYSLLMIQKEKYSMYSVKNTINNTTRSLFFLVLYLCVLCFIKSGFVFVLPTLNWRDIDWMTIATTVFI